ncbi:MAG: DUF134 domain-containing protein [Spirochaetes bacterium]|nr:DUF134 domain-containing protein [Spirochaetota bacterium]
MSRPTKCRRIGFAPDFLYFKPAGVPGNKLEEIALTIDEFEAIRLSDFEGLYHEDAARQMNISRQTFGNTLVSAHKKIADCIVNGKMIKIQGGNIELLKERSFICYDCKHEWSIPFGTGRPPGCPSCKSADIHRSEKDGGHMRTFSGRGRGSGNE